MPEDRSESTRYWDDTNDQSPEEFAAMIERMKKKQKAGQTQETRPEEEEPNNSELRLFRA